MTVDVDGDLNRTVAHLISNVSKRCTRLNEQTPKRMSQVMKANVSQKKIANCGVLLRFAASSKPKVQHNDLKNG